MRGINVDKIGLKMGDNSYRVVKWNDGGLWNMCSSDIVKIQMLVLASVLMESRQSVMSHSF
jgi:hypothetical protein